MDIMEALTSNLIDILRIESITKNEKKLCDFLEQVITHEIQGEPVQLKRINHSIVLMGDIDPDRYTIGMACHLDTVPGFEVGEWVKQDGDKIVGLGSSDMKGGVAVMLTLLKDKIFSRSRFNLIQIYYESEEGYHEQNGLHRILAQIPTLKKIDLCFVLEPTDGFLHLGCMGSMNATVTFEGKRAHSGRPWQGENSIYKAAAFFEKMQNLKPNVVRIKELDFTEVMSITMAKAGEAYNIIPDKFDLNVNIRFAPGKDGKASLKTLEEMLEGKAKINVIDISPSCKVPASNQLLAEFQNRFKLGARPKQAYTDVALLGIHGIEAINFGPGLTSQAHQRGEYILIPELTKTYEIYQSYLLEK